MKKNIILFFLIFQCVYTLYAQDTDIHVYLNNGDVHSFIYARANGMSIDNANKQYISTEDSVYCVPISEVKCIRFGEREIPIAVYEDNFAGWSDVLFCNTGLVSFHAQKDANHPERAFLMIPDDKNDLICAYAEFDEQSMPTLLSFNDDILYFTPEGDNDIICTAIIGDSLVSRFTISRDAIENSISQSRRSFKENNWVRNLCAAGNIIIGVAEVGMGSVMILGSGAIEALTLGGSTPVSIAGFVSGSLTFYGGQQLIQSGLSTWVVPAAESSKGDPYYKEKLLNTTKNLAQQSLIESKKSSKFLSKILPEEAQKYLKDPKSFKLGGALTFVSELSLTGIDAKYGETKTKADRIKEYYDLGIVLTYLPKNITHNSATVRGYVSLRLAKGYSEDAEVEYGIAVTGNHKNHSKVIKSGPGGELNFDLEGLTPGTEYTCQAYFWDRTNAIYLAGGKEKFTTTTDLPKIINFEQLYSEYSPQGFYNNGTSYDYRYHCATTVAIEDDENVEDWGYVYVDKLNGETKISLKEFGRSYRDSRWAYFRNASHDVVTFYTYVKYKDSDQSNSRRAESTDDDGYIYSEPVSFDLIYKEVKLCPDDNHPHMIDLGLPSGTKWSCCNIGASSPEDYGGYYAWGESIEKDHYYADNYSFARTISPGETYDWYGMKPGLYKFEFIGSDISGTNYDTAKVKWGDDWHLPTREQFLELKENTEYKIDILNGKNGYIITGKNGNKIFLPAAGLYEDENVEEVGVNGHYWTSDNTLLYPQGAISAGFWGIHGIYINTPNTGGDFMLRFKGCSVRPVSNTSR